jgi:hydrogenase expression/formation protein HypC
MCLGVPGRIIERSAPQAGDLATGLVEFDGLRRMVCLELVPEADIGAYVIVHAGIAINTVDTAEAERLMQHLREMDDLDIPAEPAP